MLHYYGRRTTNNEQREISCIEEDLQLYYEALLVYLMHLEPVFFLGGFVLQHVQIWGLGLPIVR